MRWRPAPPGFVTRTVAHMRALYPGASSDVIVGCLLSSGTSLPSLSARVATGSMLNDTSALNCMLTDIEPLRAEGPTLRVYPQPFREFLRLDLSSLEGGQATFRLFTTMGQQVASRRIGVGGVEEIRFAAGSLPAGMYVFQVEYEGKVWTGRIVSQP